MPIQAAPTVRESLDSAIEVVEQSIPAQETPSAEPSAIAAPEAPTPAPAQESKQQKSDRLRDEKGRYAEGKPEPKAKSAAAEPVKPKTPRPSSWRKDLEPQWETLSPELQAYVQQREKEYQTGVSTYKNEADRQAAEIKPLLDSVAPYRSILEQYKVDPAAHVGELLRSHHTLVMGTPQEKGALIARILQQNNIPLESFLVRDQQGNIFLNQQLIQSRPAPQQPQHASITPQDIDARVQQALMSRDVNQQYETFSKATDDAGQSKYPHFEELKPTMAALLEANIPEVQDYPSAYEAALAMPKHRHLATAAQPQQAQPTEANKAATVARARSQAVSVKSSTPSAMTQTQGPKGLRDQLAENFDSVTRSRV